MKVVDQSGLKVLADRGDTAAKADVASARRRSRLIESSVNAFGDESKLCISFHPERRARVMRQDKHRSVIRRLLAPPASPTLVRPRAANRAEHVSSQDPRSERPEALLRNLVIDTRFTIRLAMNPA